MNALKKILTIMVVILILIIVVGGIYTFGMGNMNHGKSGQMTMNSDQSQTTNEPEQKRDNGSDTSDSQHNTTVEQQKESAGQQQTASDQTNQQKSGETSKQVPPPGWVPVIVQSPPAANKDTKLYIAQLKEKMKAINEANSQIASNSGGAMAAQQNGAASAGQSNMNELHQGFYKLGQSVTEMEQTIDNLDRETPNPTATTPYYPYGYPQNNSPENYQYPYPPSMNNQYQGQPQEPVQQGQNHTGQQHNQTGQSTDPMSGMQMNQNTPMNHGVNLAGMFNGKTLNLVFTLILLGSIILGIIAIVGFISSLFKRGSAPQENFPIQ